MERHLGRGLPAQGQSLAVSSNAPLAGAIGNKFGGDGVSNISLPDLRQSVPVTWTSYAVCDSDGQQASSNGFVGQVRLFAGPLPTGTIAANGQSVLVSGTPFSTTICKVGLAQPIRRTSTFPTSRRQHRG